MTLGSARIAADACKRILGTIGQERWVSRASLYTARSQSTLSSAPATRGSSPATGGLRVCRERAGEEAYDVTAIPISYMGRNGKQYIAVTAATNGKGNNEALRVFALP